MKIPSAERVTFVFCLFIVVVSSARTRRKNKRNRPRPAVNEEPTDSCQLTCGPNQRLNSSKCRCVCEDGYKLNERYDRCEDINECREYPNRCSGNCYNNPGSFECRCRYGYVLHTNNWDCYKTPIVLPCKGLACYDGSSLDLDRCVCNCGKGMRYDFIEERCEDIDECLLGTHNCEQGCINSKQSFICYCEAGFTINADNRTCSPTPTGPAELPCSGKQCGPRTSLDVYHCECLCEEGYYFHINSRTCKDINECREYQGWCDGDCRNEPVGSYTCTCPSGLELDKDGWTCHAVTPLPGGVDIVECNEDDFACKDRRQCVPDEIVCDGYNDCHDGSDEKNCKEACNTQDFFCANGEKCIHKDSLCDSDNNCGDWSDEMNCVCNDEQDECGAWELRGECESNPGWMNWHCRLSCHQCVEGDGTANGSISEVSQPEAYFMRNSDKYSMFLQYTRRNQGDRPGSALNTWQCDTVTSVPRHVRVNLRLSPFYQKFTHAYAIPIVGSDRVSDEAIIRACYVVRLMLADRRDLRQIMYQKFARVGILAENEHTLNIPEHSHLPETYNDRTRSLGGTLHIPLTSAAEENLLCRENDPWFNEDTLVHSFAQSILKIGLSHDQPFQRSASEVYYSARKRGLWADTRSDDTIEQYWADGVQSYFSVQAPVQRGVHNGVDTREMLERYDPGLFKLIKEVFPCMNRMIDRCDTRGMSELQHIFSNCIESEPVETTTEAPVTEAENTENECVDKNSDCPPWAERGECTANRRWMRKNCPFSCGVCTGEEPEQEPEEEEPRPPEPTSNPDPGPANCEDSESHCQDWARRGECELNPTWMRPNCKRSCDACNDDPNCYDSSTSCAEWTADGECDKNPSYMEGHCRQSCGFC